jgi:Tol biopolymer transport system component
VGCNHALPSDAARADTHDWQPVWSSDGAKIAFSSYRDGPANIYVKPASGGGNDEPLLLSDEQKDVRDWSSDGRYLAFNRSTETTKGDVWVLPLDARRLIAVAQTTAQEDSPRFAPDGRWIACSSDENNTLIAVDVVGRPATGSQTPTFAAGEAHALFRVRKAAGYPSTTYEISRDGQRFLVGVPIELPPPKAMTVVLNWPALLKDRGR